MLFIQKKKLAYNLLNEPKNKDNFGNLFGNIRV